MGAESILRAAAAALAVVAAAGCAGPKAGTGVLRAGAVRGSEPFVLADGKGGARGLEAELAEAFAVRVGMRAEWTEFADAAELERALAEGRVDMAAGGWRMTEERRGRMDFTRPYLGVALGILAEGERAERLTSGVAVRSLEGRVGVARGSAAAEYAEAWMPFAEIREYEGAEEAVQGMKRGETDAVAGEAAWLWWRSLAGGERWRLAPAAFGRGEVAWGFRPEDRELREAANRAFADWEQTGWLAQQLRKWLPAARRDRDF